MTISLLLFQAVFTQAEEVFDSALEEGKRHGEEMLTRHSDILKPSDIPPDALPGYPVEKREEIEREADGWISDTEGMRTEGENLIRSGDPETSNASGFLEKSSEQRPVFIIDPETDPVIRNSKKAVEKPFSDCEKKESCLEYHDISWNERKSCYEETPLENVTCDVTKTVVIEETTEIWKYMTLEIDRNDSGAGFSAQIDTDGDGAADISLTSPACADRRSGDLWGDYAGFTLGGPYWKACFTLDDSGNFVTSPKSKCVSVFGNMASLGKLPLGDSRSDNAKLQSALASAIMEKFSPPEGSLVEATVESEWGKARRCREGDGDGNGWRVSYTATRTSLETEIETEDGCEDFEAQRKCELNSSVCIETIETPDGKTVCKKRRKTYRCSGSPVEGPRLLRASGKGMSSDGSQMRPLVSGTPRV